MSAMILENINLDLSVGIFSDLVIKVDFTVMMMKI
jgi:hypothetical protein